FDKNMVALSGKDFFEWYKLQGGKTMTPIYEAGKAGGDPIPGNNVFYRANTFSGNGQRLKTLIFNMTETIIGRKKTAISIKPP
ncbi:MAG: hypothetical protein VX665_03930, partial [Pseudomonadota bacterium]|nr:hypothetical protein [Pseudomonadota bacterium]